MRVHNVALGVLLTVFAARAATFDAAHPPTVRGLTGVPPVLIGNPFVERFTGALEQTLSHHPNLTLKGTVETVPLLSRATPQQALDITVDFVVYAEVVDRAPDADSGDTLTNVDVHLFDPETRSDRDAFGLLAKDDEAEEYAEIAVDALVKRLLRRRLGVMRIVTATPLRGLDVKAIGGETPPRPIPTEAFTTSSHADGYETLSPLLLEGDYRVTLSGIEGTTTRQVRVPAEGRIDLDFLSGMSAEEPAPPPVDENPSTPELPPRIVMSGVGDARLTRIPTGPTVYVRLDTAPYPLELAFRRGASGPPTLLWAQGFRPEQFRVDGNESVTLRDIPYGEYTVGAWWREPSAYGKVVVAGRGIRASFRLSARETSVALGARPTTQGSARLNIIWNLWGPPNGATLTVDGAYVADAFDAGEMSVLGLPEGMHLVRFEARGFETVEHLVPLNADRESTIFVTLRPVEP
jgi:hypothetical protein